MPYLCVKVYICMEQGSRVVHSDSLMTVLRFMLGTSAQLWWRHCDSMHLQSRRGCNMIQAANAFINTGV